MNSRPGWCFALPWIEEVPRCGAFWRASSATLKVAHLYWSTSAPHGVRSQKFAVFVLAPSVSVRAKNTNGYSNCSQSSKTGVLKSFGKLEPLDFGRIYAYLWAGLLLFSPSLRPYTILGIFQDVENGARVWLSKSGWLDGAILPRSV